MKICYVLVIEAAFIQRGYQEGCNVRPGPIGSKGSYCAPSLTFLHGQVPKKRTKLSQKLGILCHMGQEQIHARCTIKLSHSQEEQAHCCFFRMGNQWPNVGFDYF